MSQTHSFTGHLAFSTISPLVVDRFERSILVCQLELDKEAISDDCRSENASILVGDFEFLIILDS